MRPLQVATVLIVATLVAQVVAKFPFDMRHLIDVKLIEKTYGLPTTYKVPMRDGVLLDTLVFLPRGGNGTFSAVVDRSPYGHIGTELLATLFLPFGFAAVLQDLRGAGQSEGKFTFWRGDGPDAYDTFEWISKQPWSNGRVYQMGFSADGMATLAGGFGEQTPSWLKGQWIGWASATGYNTSFQGGAWVEGLLEGWLTGTGFDYTIDEVLANEQYSDWWTPIDATEDKEGRCQWPSVHWGGWFDIFQQGSLDAWNFIQEPRSGCPGQASLFIDAHGHCGFFDAGETYFPLSRLPLPVFQAIDLFLKTEGRDPVFNIDANALTFYVMGSGEDAIFGNYWTTLPTFPSFTATPFYFRTGGRLVRERVPETTGRSDFTYNPKDPQPALGGHRLLSECGQYDQRRFETRADVLVFTSETFATPVAVTGRLNATLWVSTTANDTDFVVKLLDVYPDGRAMFLADGVRRLKWRYARDQPPVLATPGAIYQVELDLWSTSYIFSPGHAIRVHVSSSSYSRYSVNYNNGLLERDKELQPPVVSVNTLFHSQQYPSQISLPIVSLDAIPHNFRPRLPRMPELKPFEKLLYLEESI